MIIMNEAEMLTTAEQIEHLRGLLAESTNHWRTVVRPIVTTGFHVDPETGEKFADGGPGPITVVTFYITHRQ